jgi:hypothetical protein
MKTLAQIGQLKEGVAESLSKDGFTVDTTYVLFFLAVEFGRTIGSFEIDTVFMVITLLMLLVLPYFLSPEEKSGFGNWLLGRSFIAGFAIILGAMFGQTLGVVLPETFRFLPMTFLIVTAMFSCYIQFYGLLRFRLAK